MHDRGGESWTFGDLGGGGGRVQSQLCLSSWGRKRERVRENENTATSVRNGGACLSLCEGPNMQLLTGIAVRWYGRTGRVRKVLPSPPRAPVTHPKKHGGGGGGYCKILQFLGLNNVIRGCRAASSPTTKTPARGKFS